MEPKFDLREGLPAEPSVSDRIYDLFKQLVFDRQGPPPRAVQIALPDVRYHRGLSDDEYKTLDQEHQRYRAEAFDRLSYEGIELGASVPIAGASHPNERWQAQAINYNDNPLYALVECTTLDDKGTVISRRVNLVGYERVRAQFEASGDHEAA